MRDKGSRELRSGTHQAKEADKEDEITPVQERQRPDPRVPGSIQVPGLDRHRDAGRQHGQVQEIGGRHEKDL